MRLTKDTAARLDYILNLSIQTDDETVEIDYSRITDDECEVFGEILESHGLGKWMGENEFHIYEKGRMYAKSGGFNMSFLERQEKEEREKRQDLLTQKQIAAAKREPYLMAWSIIATIISFILCILQFCNS